MLGYQQVGHIKMNIRNRIELLDEQIEQGEKRKKQLTSLIKKTTHPGQRAILEKELAVASNRLRGFKNNRTRILRKYAIDPVREVNAKIKYYAVVHHEDGHKIYGPFSTYGEANKERTIKLSVRKKNGT